MASDSVSVKVYLMDDDKQIDVRRFAVLKNAITSYEYLCNRFQSFMPELQHRVFKLLWLDSDGDEVTITSNEELMIAVSEFRDTVCKFIVRLVPEFAEDNYDGTAFFTFLTDFLRTPQFCEQMHTELYTQKMDELRNNLKHYEEEHKKHGGYGKRGRKHGRRHSHCKGLPTPDVPRMPCEFMSGQFGGLSGLVNAFLGYVSKAPNESEKQTGQSTSANVPQEVFVDGPPVSATEDMRMQDEASAPPPSTSATDLKDAKLKSALEMLAEMGFADENQWLTRLLGHFDGDLAKTLDHLTLGK